MKLNFDITVTEFKIVQDILIKHLPFESKVWVFGSRAKNKAQEYSDLDLALETERKIKSKIINQLKEAFEESLLPYTVDVLDINTISKSFKDNVNSQKKLFPLIFQKKTPTLRFSEFKGEWEEEKLGDIYSFYSTNSLSRDKLNGKNGLVRNIHYGDIHKKFNTLFNINNEDVPYVNIEVDLSKIKEEHYCLNGDLIIADASEDYTDIGKTIEIIKLNNEKVIAGLHTFLARPNKSEMALGYAGYLLQSKKVRIQVMTIAQGTKVLSLSTGRLANIKLNLPTTPEQRKIATFLTAVDKKIEQLSKKKDLLKKYKKALMQKLFSQTIRFKANDGSNFLDWEEKSLKELGNIKKGTQLSKVELIKEGMYPAINGGKNPSGYTNKWNTKENTITISEGGNSCGYVNLITSKFWTGGHCYNIEELKLNTLYKFLFQILKFNEDSIMRLRVGSGLPNIQKKNINDFKIILPSLSEQTKIANFLSSLDQKITKINNQLKKSKKYKKSLLQKMFI